MVKKTEDWVTDEVLDDQDSRPPSDYQPDPNDQVPDYLKPAGDEASGS
jgi:hypothetical protein